MKRGFTLVELLIGMAILLIISGGVFYAFRDVFRKGTPQALVAKQEQDVQFIVSNLVMELSTVGFGVDRSRLVVLNNGTNLSDVTDPQNPQAVIAVNGSHIAFLSLATRQGASIGCWGTTGQNNDVTTNARDYLFRPCSGANWGSSEVLCLDPTTKDINSSCSNALVFYKGDRNYPADFITQYYLVDYRGNNKPGLCAEGTHSLYKKLGSDSAQPLVDCVGAFRVRYITNRGYSDQVDNIDNLLGLRLCIILQVGGRQSTQANVNNFSESCGGPIYIPPKWRDYRWSTVEVDIPLKNIR